MSSIIDRINQRQARSAEEVDAVAAAEAADAQRPDAVVQADEARAAFRTQFAGMPDQELQEEQAGPEEQALHTKMEQEMIQLVNSANPGSTQALLKAVMSAQDPVQGVGMVASDVVRQLKNSHPNVTQDVLFSIGERTVEEIVELVETANPRIDLTEDEMAEALAIGVQDYNASHPEEIDQATVQEFLAS